MKTQAAETTNFKYRALRDWLVENIDKGRFQYGDKLPSENMLCSKFSVSRQTVRKALDELEDVGAIERRKGSGSYVKKQMLKPKNNMVGVCMSFLDNYIFPEVLSGIEGVLTEAGYGIDLGFGHNRVENEARFLERMIDSNVAGLIVEGIKSALPNPNIKYYKALTANKVPIVFVNNYYPDFPCTCVLMEDEKWTYDITNLLIAAGHKKIAGYFKFDDLQGHWRYAGYIRAMMDAGLEVDENCIGWYDSSNTAHTPQKMDMLEEDLVSSIDECTALVCYNDFVAKRLIGKLDKKGRKVPDDISIVGFDNSVDAKINGNDLTSVNHPKEKVGIEAAQRLLHLIKNPEEIKEERVCCYMPSFIRERSSIKKISE